MHTQGRATPSGVVRYVNVVGVPGPGSPRGVLPRQKGAPVDRLPITGVRLGPAQVTQNSRGATKALLARNGYDVAVENSSAALR